MFRFLRIALGVAFLAFALSHTAVSQTEKLPDQIVAVGVALNQYSTPQIQGWGLYGMQVTSGVYSLSTYDITAVPNTSGEVLGVFPQLQYSARTGIALHITDFTPKVSLWGLGDAGMAVTGDKVGASYGAGGFGLVKFGRGWGALLIMRVVHNELAGTQYIPEVGIAYGKQ